jgi:hypothetical protein
MNTPDKTPNPILAATLGMMESVAPGAFDDPEAALRDLTSRLRYLVIERIEKPTIAQLEALRAFDAGSNLAQIRKAVQAGQLHLGPFLGELAETVMIPQLVQQGLSVSLRELTEAEKAQQTG